MVRGVVPGAFRVEVLLGGRWRGTGPGSCGGWAGRGRWCGVGWGKLGWVVCGGLYLGVWAG